MWIDTHCHWDDGSFADDFLGTVEDAVGAQIEAVIVPAIARSNWAKVADLTVEKSLKIYPAFGLHPLFLAEHRLGHLDELLDFCQKNQAVAIGECGLDYFVPELPEALQQQFFVEQIKIAKLLNLPLIIHARRSVDAVMAILRRFSPLRGVVHSFAGSLQQAQQLHKLGFLLGVGGTVTYPRAQRLRQVVAAIPLEQLLLETDAPDQPPCGFQGQRNVPARLLTIAESVATLRGVDLATLAAITTANAKNLFSLQ
jgi:TatD DNase family protein